ncbi:hypothetical protein MLD38_032107 [Melastoma candidum]|nr:hypothetical protein MLD38_032107 [Melastoma candidum]
MCMSKPMDFMRTRRSKKQDEGQVGKRDDGASMILADDHFEDQLVPMSSSAEKVLGVEFSILPDHKEYQKVLVQPRSSAKSRECDPYQPTVFTKETMDDIHKMSGMPLDFKEPPDIPRQFKSEYLGSPPVERLFASVSALKIVESLYR